MKQVLKKQQAIIKSPPTKTRERLLTNACRLFAEKGCQNTPIAEICEQAELPIASVNYHFRDKTILYLDAWRHTFQEDLKAYPPDGGLTADTRRVVMDLKDAKAYAEHVVKFSLAGIKAMLRLLIRTNNGKEIQLREVVEIDLDRASP